MPRYQVRLKNQSGIAVAYFDEFNNLEVGKRVNDVGYMDMRISGDDPRVDLFEIDGQIEVWRRDKINNVSWYLEWEGFVVDQKRETLVSGEKVFEIRGKTYSDLLFRKIVAYYSGSSYAFKSGPVESIMKEFVEENLGFTSSITPPRFGNGEVPGLTIEADGGNGATWVGGRAFQNILSLLQELANFGNIDFDIIGNGVAQFEFRTYLDQLGDDRTNNNLDPNTGLNGSGNVPIVFSLGLGNMYKPSYDLTRSSEKNVIYALGPGEGSARVVLPVENSNSLGLSPFQRREVSRNGSAETTFDGLFNFGEKWLLDLQAEEKFKFEVLQLPSVFYGKGEDDPNRLLYYLGDRVTIQYDDIVRDKRITAVRIVITGDQRETVNLTFSDIPTLG